MDKSEELEQIFSSITVDIESKTSHVDVYSTIGKKAGIKATLRVSNKQTNFELVLKQGSIISSPIPSQSQNKVDFFEKLKLEEKIVPYIGSNNTSLFQLQENVSMKSFHFAACICIGFSPPRGVHFWTTTQDQQQLLFQLLKQVFVFWKKDLKNNCNEESVYYCICKLLPFTSYYYLNASKYPSSLYSKRELKKLLTQYGFIARKYLKQFNLANMDINYREDNQDSEALLGCQVSQIASKLALKLYKRNLFDLLNYIHAVHQELKQKLTTFPSQKLCFIQ